MGILVSSLLRNRLNITRKICPKRIRKIVMKYKINTIGFTLSGTRIAFIIKAEATDM